MKIALGTAQFGLDYGVANDNGQISHVEAEKILDFAWSSGIDTLDTAIGYGDSEERLGQVGVEKWRIVSKLPGLSGLNEEPSDWIKKSVEMSLKKLGITSLTGFLLHRPLDLLSADGQVVYRVLNELKSQGVIDKIGVSVCDGPTDLDAIWSDFPCDMVQSPLNLLDRRLITSGWAERLKKHGVEVHTRSAFLQGVLLMERRRRPAYFDEWKSLWDEWHKWLDDVDQTPLQACLNFSLALPQIDRVVVGVDSVRHLREVLESFDEQIRAPGDFASEDVDLINPACWTL